MNEWQIYIFCYFIVAHEKSNNILLTFLPVSMNNLWLSFSCKLFNAFYSGLSIRVFHWKDVKQCFTSKNALWQNKSILCSEALKKLWQIFPAKFFVQISFIMVIVWFIWNDFIGPLSCTAKENICEEPVLLNHCQNYYFMAKKLIN